MQKGVITPHNHSSTAGDGGQLSNPTITGVVTVTAEPSANLQLSTLEVAAGLSLLFGA